jgi:hypothetical protein
MNALEQNDLNEQAKARLRNIIGLNDEIVDIHVGVLDDGVNGADGVVLVRRHVSCFLCNGDGERLEANANLTGMEMVKCTLCGGTGTKPREHGEWVTWRLGFYGNLIWGRYDYANEEEARADFLNRKKEVDEK